ncbi:hypothetical protein [Limobrevibacterium gyesilva]|uniref:Uncharacterized protein n=1 Tax=Limobrevibacterium gyesilva TaxID=2991712 RepID=A0AA41YLG0_9PROT|nr:hypothetical protein [Limobrevibacterium gyesilva]MCW3474596.1 hypothetical protein [Limobrevibacterium gyesilva]
MTVLHAIATQLLSTSSMVAAMRGHPEFQSWADALVALAADARLRPLQPLLGEVARDALATATPLNRLDSAEARKIPYPAYLAASDVAEEALKRAPGAAFALSLVAMLGWASALGDGLLDQEGGMPHPGWVRIPHVCAHACLRIGALEAARKLVDVSYDTLMAAKYAHWDERLQAAMVEYRALMGRIERRYDADISGLADDLRAACQPGAPDFRAETGAILWSLGMVPESRVFRPGAATVPSPRLFRRIVEQSLACIPHDPLVQYVWLAMKDRPPFNIRDHASLFGRINLRYGQMLLDELGEQVPSEVYANTLIAWFRGTLGRGQVDAYLTAHALINEMFPGMIDWTVYLRWHGLAYFLAKQFGLLKAPHGSKEETAVWRRLTELATSIRENGNLHPEWPQMHARANLGLFHFIETHFAAAGGNAGHLHEAALVVEKMRSSALAYWLKIVPPDLSDSNASGMKPLLEKEQELLGYLRGAYFLMLYPMLPMHYRRYGMQLEEMLQEGDDAARRRRMDPDAGRAQYKELSQELATLHGEMQRLDPDYARKRLEPWAATAALARALGRHASPP